MTTLSLIAFPQTTSKPTHVASPKRVRRDPVIALDETATRKKAMPAAPWTPSTPAIAEGDLESADVVILHYWASWNLDDRETDRRLADLRQAFGDRVRFCSCDIDAPRSGAFIHGMGNFPAVGCFVRGQWCESLIGLRSVDELHATFSKCLASASRQPRRPVREAGESGVFSLVRSLISLVPSR